MNIDIISQSEMEDLLAKKIEENGDQKLNNWSALQHFKNAMGEWKREQNWSSARSYVHAAKDDDGTVLGVGFLSATSRPPTHITFRHVFVFEEARGRGVAGSLYNFRYHKACDLGITRIRMFANIPALDYHVASGMRFIAMNKAKQPFTYLPLKRFPTLKEYGEWLDSIGPRAAIEMVEPEVTKQVDKLIAKGGRWYTDEEFEKEWGTPLAPRESSTLEAFL